MKLLFLFEKLTRKFKFEFYTQTAYIFLHFCFIIANTKVSFAAIVLDLLHYIYIGNETQVDLSQFIHLINEIYKKNNLEKSF